MRLAVRLALVVASATARADLTLQVVTPQPTRTLRAASGDATCWRLEPGETMELRLAGEGTLSIEARVDVRDSGRRSHKQRNLNNPRDIVLTPCATAGHPKTVVADTSNDQIVLVDNCGAGTCNQTVLATGFSEPWGLWFEDATHLLVTDRGSDTVYRLTGDFCSL